MESPNKEIYTDPFPEVTLAYKTFEKTTDICLQKLFDNLEPQVMELNQKFKNILEHVAKKEGTLDKKFIFLGEEGLDSFGVLPSIVGHYLEWDNKQKDEFSYVSCLIHDDYRGDQPSKYIPGSNDFIGFNQWRKEDFRRNESKIVPNLPNPSKDHPGYNRYQPVTYLYDKFLDALKDFHGNDKSFVSQVNAFNKIGKKLEDQTLKEKEKLGKKIKDRALQLSVAMKGDFLSRLSLPKHISHTAATQALIDSSGINIYYFPKEGKLRRIKIKTKPNHKKGQEASLVDWFEVGPILIPGIVSKLKDTGWEKPS